MSSIEFDGLVVEGPGGVRLVAIPTALLGVLRDAEVIQFKNGDRVSRMKVGHLLDLRDANQEEVAAATQDAIHSAANSAAALASSAVANPSPTPPPAPGEGENDPADIPVRAKRGNEWVTVYLTRAQYEEHVKAGRITHALPQQVRGVDGATDGV